jgi:hypothetical protein
VLKFAPADLPQESKPNYEVTPTVDLPALETQTAPPRAHYIEREVLYRLVWEAPVAEVAMRFGITDVGLAKACRRADIPIPPRGYWAKVEAGVPLLAPPLPPALPGSPAKIRIKGRQQRGADPESAAIGSHAQAAAA